MNRLLPITIIITLGITGLLLWHHARNNNLPQPEANTIIVGTSADYPPFSFIEDDTIVGFDIDVAKEVTKRLNKQICIEDMPFDALIIEAQQGRIDVIAAGMTSTPEREQRLFFSKPYIAGDPLLIISLAKNPKFESVDQLKEKEVIVNEGFVSDMYMSRQEGVRLVRLASVVEGFCALEAGRADAFVVARNATEPFFKKYSKHNFHITPLEGTSDSYSLAVSRAKPALFKEIEGILDEMEKDGTLENLKKKWNLQ